MRISVEPRDGVSKPLKSDPMSVSRNLCNSLRHHAFTVHDAESVHRRCPIMNGHGPALRGALNGQVEHLEHRLIIGECASILEHPSQAVVQRLDRIGGVDELADLWGKVEEGGQACPVLAPTASDDRVVLSPTLL